MTTTAAHRRPATSYRTPGVYFERLSQRPPLRALRTDVAGFVGIAERGPLFAPVRVESPLQFHTVFGRDRPDRYLAAAVNGFFQNGGDACYVVRVADREAARAASWNLVDKHRIPSIRLTARHPGTWADAGRLRISVDALGEDRFNLNIELQGELRQQFRRLTMDDSDPDRYALDVLNDERESPLVSADLVGDGTPRGHLTLGQGQDGLRTLGPDHFIEGLEALSKVDEVAILAVPDVMSKPTPVRGAVTPSDPKCDVLEPPEGDGTRYTVREGDTLAMIGAQFGLSVADLRTANALGVEQAVQPGQLLSIPRKLREVEFPPAFDHDAIARVYAHMLTQCERLKDRFAVLDVPIDITTADRAIAWRRRFSSYFGAVYWPWIRVGEASGSGDRLVRGVPPSGHVVGVFARVDRTIGVHKAPANETVSGARDIAQPMDDDLHGDLNHAGVNVIRPYPGRGVRVMGARTTAGRNDSAWRYTNVRRLVSMIEESVDQQLQWTVFEPNSSRLWTAMDRVLTAFLTRLWRQGMLDGPTPGDAFAVRCDESTNPPEVQDRGMVVSEISLTVAWPMETIVVRIGKTEDGSIMVEELSR